MKRIHTLLIITFALLFVAISCSDKDELPKAKPPKPGETTIPIISQFVYDGLSTYYLWSDQMTSIKPTEKDTDPKKYFKSVLYNTDIDNGWSWITDDAKGLVADFAGEPKSFGYSISFSQINGTIYAFVKYVFANSPAANAGLERLDLIGKVNGQPITTEKGSDGKDYISKKDIDILYGDKTATFTTYKLTDSGIVLKKEVQVTPATIKTDPVLFDKVYLEGNKKIGYLFYTGFIGNYNDRLFEVFNNFKSQGVTDLVIDLRYNPGGGVSAASYLVSLFAPKASVIEKTTLTTLNYNQFLNNLYDKNKWSRSYKLGVFQEKDELDNMGNIVKKAAPDPIVANLDLNKIYIIATGNSASASELITFCSRAIMGESNVIHIGERTSGKYTASFTIHPYDDNIGQPIYDDKKLSAELKKTFENWAMQPIVAIYTDKNDKTFINPGYLEPNVTLKEGFGYIDYWKPIGDTKDVFLGQALYMITGNENYKPVKPVEVRSKSSEHIMIDLPAQYDEAKPLLIDNMKLSPEDVKEISRMRNSVN